MGSFINYTLKYLHHLAHVNKWIFTPTSSKLKEFQRKYDIPLPLRWLYVLNVGCQQKNKYRSAKVSNNTFNVCAMMNYWVFKVVVLSSSEKIRKNMFLGIFKASVNFTLNMSKDGKVLENGIKFQVW